MKLPTVFFILQYVLNQGYVESFQVKHFSVCRIVDDRHTTCPTVLMAESDDDFWSRQRALMEEMTDKTEKSFRKEQLSKYAELQAGLVGDTGFFSAMIFSLLWLACENPFVPFSYLLGAVFGLAYAYGLGKYVETLGGTIEDASSVQGAGVGQARFAFLILLFIFVGKLRIYGLIEIPSILGFFTYQLASLSQGLRDANN